LCFASAAPERKSEATAEARTAFFIDICGFSRKLACAK
jgi:hypothetical protein